MLPNLNEDPPDTKTVVEEYNNTTPPPKHQLLRFLLYLFLGFLVFAVVFIITTFGILYYFKINLQSFLSQTKTDAFSLVKMQQTQILTTPTPTASWSSYTSSSQHFTIQYPSTWIVDQDTDESIILYPPGSLSYAELTQADIGAGLGPRIFITVITRPFVIPDSQYTKITSTDGITGYVYTDQTSGIPTVDFPFQNKTEILEFTLHNIGQEDIDQHLSAHKSKLVVKDIDMETFNKIVASLQFTKN